MAPAHPHPDHLEFLGAVYDVWIAVAVVDPNRSAPITGIEAGASGRTFAMSRGEFHARSHAANAAQQEKAWREADRLDPRNPRSPTIAQAVGALGQHSQRTTRCWAVVDGLRAVAGVLGAFLRHFGARRRRQAALTVCCARAARESAG